jgi:hypothetical protein
MSNISLVETDKINEKIQVILRQTDYTEEVALEKLKDNNFDEIKTIKSYFGIEEKKPSQIKSVNQEIYKQIRYKLDSNMRDYNARVERGEVKKVV